MEKKIYWLLLGILFNLNGLLYGQKYPFPQNVVYKYGMMPTNKNAQDASSAYSSWKTNFLTECSNGRYRVKFDDPNQTVSEGVAYGMLLTAYAGEKNYFDGLWNYYKDNRNSNLVMNWKIGGCSGTIGSNGASDAELDAAMALIVAHYQWGSTGIINYEADAKELINIIKNKEIEAGSYVLKPGDMFGGSNITNPSYYAPGYYRVFGTFNNDATYWNAVAAKSYEVINNNLRVNAAKGGLVSDWCKADGSYSGDAGGYAQGGKLYLYDAARTPWRIAVDYLWYGNADAKAYCLKTSDFVRVDLGGTKNIKDGYYQNGQAYGQWHNNTFVGAFACAAMGGGDQSHLDASYADNRDITQATSYFNHTLKCLYLFLQTGNFYLPIATNTTPTNVAPTVTITSPANNATFSAPANINIAANAVDSDGSIAKVEFYRGSVKLGEDPTAPYTFTLSNVAEGSYTFTAKAFDNLGAVTTSSAINVTVNSTNTGGITCSSTGTILREYWANISGTSVTNIPLNNKPTSASELSIFEGPSDVADNYGSRIRGYVCPPTTGNYTFWIASDDNSELWISSDENPSNRRKIASVTGWTNSREWTKFPEQQSGAIYLTAGKKYYIEALHKEGTGGDNIAVGWQLPEGTYERPINGNRLSPWNPDGASIVTDRKASSLKEDLLVVHPNPASNLINVDYFSDQSMEVKISVSDIISKERLNVSHIMVVGQNSFNIDINSLEKGIYLVTINNGGEKIVRRIIKE